MSRALAPPRASGRSVAPVAVTGEGMGDVVDWSWYTVGDILLRLGRLIGWTRSRESLVMISKEDTAGMSDDATTAQIPFGTVAATFATVSAAEAAAASLAGQGYPRELIKVMTGQPWQEEPSRSTGLRPDPELRFQLTPTLPPALTSDGNEIVNPALADFARPLLRGRRQRNSAFWPLIALVLGIVATLLALYTRDWIVVTVVGLAAVHVVVGVAVLAYVRHHEVTFPFRGSIPTVEEVLEHGGALVTVNCTLPYNRPIQQLLTEHGGTPVGFAAEVVYPVPA